MHVFVSALLCSIAAKLISSDCLITQWEQEAGSACCHGAVWVLCSDKHCPVTLGRERCCCLDRLRMCRRACVHACVWICARFPPSLVLSQTDGCLCKKWTQIRFQLVLLWHFQQPCRPLHHQIPSLLLIKHSCALKTVSKIRQMSTSLAWPSISFMPNQQCGHMPLLNSQLRTAFRNITAADWSGSGDCSWGFQGSNDGWSVGPGSLSGALSSLSLEVTHGRGLFNSHLLFVIKASKWWDEGQNKVCAM